MIKNEDIFDHIGSFYKQEMHLFDLHDPANTATDLKVKLLGTTKKSIMTNL